MTEKENNILQASFLDFPIICSAEHDISKINSSGSNQKKLLIVCQEEEDHNANINLLEKILEAVNYKLDTDCLLVCLGANEGLNFSALQQTSEFKNVLIFGSIARKLGLNFEFEWYYPLHHQDVRFLFANSLSVIAQDRKHKGALWTALKEMFLS